MEGGLPIGADEKKCVAWSMTKQGNKFEPIWIPRGNCGDDHVKLETLFSGICHTDCHFGSNFTGTVPFPLVPGHEILGRVTELGKNVTKFKVGDLVGVGCTVDSCMKCNECLDGGEQYCNDGRTSTYAGTRNLGHIPGNKDLPTYGGYSEFNVVHEHFVFAVPEDIPLEAAGPILCAGVTMYDPLRHWGATTGKKMTIGIVGIGGLGTMGIKLAKALGHDVIAISTSVSKEALAKEKGATHFCVSKDPESIKTFKGKCNLILNTAGNHDVNVYMPLLAKSGTMIQIGVNMTPITTPQMPMVFNRLSIAGSFIGGCPTHDEVFALCAKHQIWPDT
jgi:uncharacterized zinc-type alcohol dehydrogenase-like protein